MDLMRECRNQAELRRGAFERLCERKRWARFPYLFLLSQAGTKLGTHARNEFREALPPCLCLLKGQLCLPAREGYQPKANFWRARICVEAQLGSLNETDRVVAEH